MRDIIKALHDAIRFGWNEGRTKYRRVRWNQRMRAKYSNWDGRSF